MNIFRSEEHVRNWSYFEAESEDAIMPVADWAKVFAGPLFRRRLDADYLSNIGEYAGEFRKAFAELGKTGPFWQPRR
jgi:hypothetical protein